MLNIGVDVHVVNAIISWQEEQWIGQLLDVKSMLRSATNLMP
jgi:hypothetical protein